MNNKQKQASQIITYCTIGFIICAIVASIADDKQPTDGHALIPSSAGGEKPPSSSSQSLPATFYEVEMNVSAYCPCEKCCGKWADGITASGKPAEGLLIAAPPEYAFGTIMEIPGYGMATVEDRGGAIKGNKIDLLFPTHQEALNWGRQYLKVKVYK